ncbi:hypothetical protein GGR51DRAFT_207216 [Nemania sp. FL0031]|nr:hypothetical protein GGR51DRAFT_207216 [Nemania sp. FL0031]
MITRRAPVGAVCFRCRLRLLQQLTPVRYVASDATSDAATNAPHVDVDVDVDGPTDAEVPVQHVRDPANRNKNRRPERKQQQLLPHLAWKKLNLHNRHVSGNRVLDEATRSLGTDMLGQPGYAIVMKDGGKIKKKQFPSLPIEPATESSSNVATSIEALVESQRQRPTIDQIRSNIHELQPADKALPEKEFAKLKYMLTEGFLSTQLKSYMEWHKSEAQGRSKKRVADTPSSPKFSWIKEWLPWVPLQPESATAEATNFTLQGYISDTTTPKEKLAIRLMRECWQLSVIELDTQLGETQVKLHDHEFVLLMRGTQRFMNTLGDIWLDQGEKIEAFRKQNTLRFVTSKPKADAILRDLDNTLGSVTQKAFPAVLVTPEEPDDTVLEELGRITNTYITRSRTLRRAQLHVAWIEIKSRAAQGFTNLEDLAHIVMRLLLTASGSRQATSTLFSPTIAQTSPGRLIVDVTSKDKLGWKDRLTQWARYMQPLTPKQSIADVALPIEEFELPFEPSEETKTLKDDLFLIPDPKFPFHPVKWTSTLPTSTVARFGQILHPYQPSNPTPPLSDLLLSTDRRVFVSTTPHPLRLTTFENSDTNTIIAAKSTIVLHFWPSPSPNPATRGSKKSKSKTAGDTPPAPLLELRLATSENEVLGVESLRAVSRTHHTDVLLPSSLVDVRFTQTQYETLQARDRETLDTWAPLADFLGVARLDLENGKLEMPPRQRFPVPRRLFAATNTTTSAAAIPPPPPSTEDAGSAAEQSLSQPDETLSNDKHHEYDELESISYEFVGLEFHRSVALPYEGHQLTYTSIEAGQGGGRRAEVTLEPVKQPESESTEIVDNGKQQEEFLACCARLAADRSLWSGLSDHIRT